MQILQYIFFLCAIRFHSVKSYYIQNQNQIVPICVNCKFFIANKNECSKFGEVNIVSGKYRYESATIIRKDEDKCGKYAFSYKENHYKFITQPYYFVLEHGIFLFYISAYSYVLWIYYFFFSK
jgi:hypothetical protein